MVGDDTRRSEEQPSSTTSGEGDLPRYEPPAVLELGEMARASNMLPDPTCPGGGGATVTCGGGGSAGGGGTCGGGGAPVTS